MQIHNAKDIGIVMPMYSLRGYNDNYSEASGSLCQSYRDSPNNQNLLKDKKQMEY